MESCFGFIAVNILIAEDSSERVYHSKSFLDDREIVEYEPCAFFLCVTLERPEHAGTAWEA